MRKLLFVSPTPPSPFLPRADDGATEPQDESSNWPEVIASYLQEQQLLPHHLLHGRDAESIKLASAIAKQAREQRRIQETEHQPKRLRNLPLLKSQRLLPRDTVEYKGDLPQELWREVHTLILTLLNEDVTSIGVIVAHSPTIERLRRRLEPMLRFSSWYVHPWFTELTIQNDARGHLQHHTARR